MPTEPAPGPVPLAPTAQEAAPPPPPPRAPLPSPIRDQEVDEQEALVPPTPATSGAQASRPTPAARRAVAQARCATTVRSAVATARKATVDLRKSNLSLGQAEKAVVVLHARLKRERRDSVTLFKRERCDTGTVVHKLRKQARHMASKHAEDQRASDRGMKRQAAEFDRERQASAMLLSAQDNKLQRQQTQSCRDVEQLKSQRDRDVKQLKPQRDRFFF